MNERARLLQRGIRLEQFTAGYNVLEGVVAITAGVLAGSVALVGFGADSAIETLSALVVLWHLQQEKRGGTAEALDCAERRAQKLVAVTLAALCAYVIYESVRTFWMQQPPQESRVGIGLAALSLVLMPILGLAKRRTGRRLGSRALVADAAETMACAYLSLTLLLGLVANALFGWWWADPAAALVMVPFILREAREAWEGEECEESC